MNTRKETSRTTKRLPLVFIALVALVGLASQLSAAESEIL